MSTYVTLCVYDGDPDRVTEALRLPPTRTRRKGERWKTRRGLSSMPARVDGWFLESRDAVASDDLCDHLGWLLERIEPHAAALDDLRRDGCSARISCYWHSAYGQGGPTLSPDVMRRMAALDLPIWLDLYYDDEAPNGSAPGETSRTAT